MKVEISYMRLRNFKGVADTTFDFSHNTAVRGTNGSGKTTLADAYFWCLFGKDSHGRTEFGIKRRDAKTNEVIHHQDYSVEVCFLIDGKERKFERVLTEEWTRPRGAIEKVLTSHKTIYIVDGIKCATKREYDKAISAIAAEDVFRMMTDVNYFVGLKDDDKRKALIAIAYGTESATEADKMAADEVLASTDEFNEFAEKLGGQRIEDYRKSLEQRKKAVKGQAEDTARIIDSKRNDMPQAEDWDAIQQAIDAKKADIRSKQESVAQLKATASPSEIHVQIANKQVELSRAESAVFIEVSNHNSAIDGHIAQCNADINMLESSIAKDREERARQEVNRDRAEANVLAKQQQFKDIKSGAVSLPEEELVCTACGRPFDKNNAIQQKLATIREEGKKLRADYEGYVDSVIILGDSILQNEDSLAKKREELAEYQSKRRDSKKEIASDKKCSELRNQLDSLKAKVSGEDTDSEAIEAQIASLEEQIKVADGERDTLVALLHNKTIIEESESKIASLSEELQGYNNQLDEIDALDAIAIRFAKAKDEQVLKRINSQFRMVTWSFVTEQLVGEKIACNCIVEGIPYTERNNAGRINAGLDIINTLSRHHNVSLPIFVDNAESVVEFIETDSQQIRLYVDERYKELSISQI